MDTTTAEIIFDENGICNFCTDAMQVLAKYEKLDKAAELNRWLEAVRRRNRKRTYDIVIGVSGGVDSSYVAYYTTKVLGLRPLAVHIDNGWDVELAVKNIEELVRRLEIDLHTVVLDWEKFRKLQLSFLRSSTPDLEIPTDHALSGALYHTTIQENIGHLVPGGNTATESILPLDWSRGNWDWRYVSSIYRIFEKEPLRPFPHLSLFDRICAAQNWRVRRFWVLDYIDYSKSVAEDLLKEQFGWRPYGNKHFESAYTKFYQAVLLPKKFGFDKRKAHFSSLICSGQLTRDRALAMLQQPPLDEEEIAPLTEYVAKKLEIAPDEMQRLLSLPNKSFWDYPSQESSFVWTPLQLIRNWAFSR
jgi:N-acetyl sugar amidotransferase